MPCTFIENVTRLHRIPKFFRELAAGTEVDRTHSLIELRQSYQNAFVLQSLALRFFKRRSWRETPKSLQWNSFVGLQRQDRHDA
jgi:hypothetical protein